MRHLRMTYLFLDIAPVKILHSIFEMSFIINLSPAAKTQKQFTFRMRGAWRRQKLFRYGHGRSQDFFGGGNTFSKFFKNFSKNI